MLSKYKRARSMLEHSLNWGENAGPCFPPLHAFSSLSSSCLQTVELKVAMDCERCENKVRKTLANTLGVESVDIDFQQQRVTVMGYLLDAKKLMKKVRSKTGMHAEVWNHQYSNVQHVYGHMDTSLTNLFSSASDYNTNNYYDRSHRMHHGSTYRVSDKPAYDHEYGNQKQYMPPVDDSVTTMFTDENPNACSIM
ncbi:heavy metal-associated isoprenylated plant protein 31 [Selaginella moellendorffii]|uniref:heavy metal-associated isoprenylated plant protein 31 n=1 Tax=Selaginella moellendorffii TaxID=88036 RepID=UPI000D1D010A|nr:heavy metal-associated isoprenylated plant protein 31 [Selaginella moellendorffii]|eukprot:XP_024515433.1 heavy metal-associated isoprenylated plant protein 31 [Selaginella moellendorffii]